MSKPDGRSIFDILSNGWTRSVIPTNNQGTLGVNLPKDLVNKHSIEKGDDVVIREPDPDTGDAVIELHVDEPSDDE